MSFKLIYLEKETSDGARERNIMSSLCCFPLAKSNSSQKARKAFVAACKGQPLEAQGRIGKEWRMDLHEPVKSSQHSHVIWCIP